MRQITQQQISAFAPNAAAVSNAKKISQKGGFVKLNRSEDDTFYMGECSGSEKSNYLTSADFINPDQPVFRCSCPSRQFPCKHSLALLYEIMEQKNFELCEIPENIIEKRAKKDIRESKKKEQNSAPKKVNKTARIKKLQKQLEGLDMTEQLVSSLLGTGLGTMGGTSIKAYRDLAKQLGDYYLPGPQIYVNRLILEMEAFQKDSDTEHYQSAIQLLIKLRALIQKARAYLKEKLDSGNLEDDDSFLYEGLGGIWQLERLQQLGLKKENARLVQLSFDVYYDEARKEFVDRGYWADLDSAQVSVTYNFRPVKALKYVKQEDTVFETANVPLLTYYPGELNRRIRWEAVQFTPLKKEDLQQLREKVYQELAPAVKLVKNSIKNMLSDDQAALMVYFRRIGETKQGYVLEDREGKTILLDDMPGSQKTTGRLSMLPDKRFLTDQVLFGAFYYDKDRQRICIQPYSIVTEDEIIRLQY